MTFIHVREVRVTGPCQLWIRFSDGASGNVDLASEMWGAVFEPLNDQAFFARAMLDENAYTVCWPNGADFAPEFLRERLSGQSGQVAERPAP